MSSRKATRAAVTPRAVPGSVSRELRELAAFAGKGGPGTPAAAMAAGLAEAAGYADHVTVRRLATEAAADPQVAAATLGVLSFALADTARKLGIAQAALGAAPGDPE